MEIQRALVITGIAIVSYLMIQAWQQDYANPTQPAPVEEVAQSAQGNGDGLDLPSPQADEVDNGIPSAQSERVEAPSSESTETTTRQQRIRVNTDVLRVEIDPQGGDIVRLALPEFPHHVDTPDQPFVLLEQDASRTYVAQSGLIGKNGTDSSAGRPLWSAAKQSYQLDEGTQELNVDLTLRQDNGAELVKRFTFERGSYLVRVSHIVRNQGNSEWSGALYGQIKRDGSEDPGLSNSGFIPMPTYLGGAYWDSKKPYNKLDFEDMSENPLDLTVQGGWLAMAQHYFVTAWVPDAQQKNHYSSVHLEKRGQYLLRFVSPTLKVAPGEEKVLYAEFYAGPKQQDKLEAISPGLNMTVDYGWLWFISQPIFALLVFLQSGEVSVFGMDIDIGMGVGNWGVAIILLTLIIKAIFFKLSATSYRSMAKMRKVAPEMQRIKEQNKNDKQKAQMETMKLFQREKINPLGGCLPMLVQMPVFIALYYVLLESVELRQAPFFLWINDLSVMDPYFVLPILMGASMFLQTRLNPTPADPMQAQVMKWMPVVFSVFMLWFPAGLVLYWLTNNILSIAQQWVITRKIENEG
ncbi:MAG: membrane protein insertase YidC [Alcanivorax sp.]|uniref:membrane protein insertase YidC n=1 Tax=unclassified Alcanivorax TaxID=2638842 RepID=UPI000C972624|nr:MULTISPECIES: membrane protein insertase YidC [unclassified Alcanivorax]MAC15083.1 membrane protein insertase YidC [Alcanivorax sp.]|tara:strand:+ start:1412 stop:3148 length:1737 start_codon:yes stop_codon:yes gene_type:complete